MTLRSLTPSHLRQLLDGRHRLLAITNDVVALIPDKYHAHAALHCGASDKARCMELTLQVWRSEAGALLESGELHRQPLELLNHIPPVFTGEKGSGTCHACRNHMLRLIQAARAYIWDEIPYAFSLKDRQEGVIYSFDRIYDIYGSTA